MATSKMPARRQRSKNKALCSSVLARESSCHIASVHARLQAGCCSKRCSPASAATTIHPTAPPTQTANSSDQTSVSRRSAAQHQHDQIFTQAIVIQNSQ